MLQISVDLTVLSQSQREAFADFILSFPNSGDDPEDEGSTIGFEFPNVSEDISHPTEASL
jgi:hypothetical protein